MPRYVMGKAIAGMRNSYRRESGLNHTFIVDLNAPLIEKPKREEVSLLFPPDVSFTTQSMKCESYNWIFLKHNPSQSKLIC